MMRRFTLRELAGVLGVTAPESGGEIENVSTDSRALGPGDLFVALRGDHFDGHRFLGQALQAGAVAAVVDTLDRSVDLPQLQVADTVQALALLAGFNRNQSGASVVAVTGSSGKTTVKEMLAAILGREGQALATQGNLNNHIGVPLTLFRISPHHWYAVVELGASGVGEIAHTVAITRPDVAIITNAGEAHLEGFGSYQNIVQGKGEIIDGVGSDGVVVLNRDDPAFDTWRQRAGARQVISVSAAGNSEADYQCLEARTQSSGHQIRVQTPHAGVWVLNLALPGVHNITNALLAIAAVSALGVGEAAIGEALATVQPATGRLERQALNPRITLIDDSYNANPTSMKAALDVLAGETTERVAVLGAMAELGREAEDMHRSVGEHARRLGIEHLVVVGDSMECQALISGFGENAVGVANHQQAADWLLNATGESMTVLIKGSRSSAMDRIIKILKEKVTHSCCSG